MSESIDVNMALVQQANSGDRDALDELLSDRQLNEMVRARIRNMLRNCWLPISEEDIFQETHLDVIRGIVNLRVDSPDSFKGWLRTIARNNVLDAIRNARRTYSGALPDDSYVNIHNSAVESPSRLAVTQENVELVRGAIQQLPEEYRSVMELKCMQSLSNDDIAEVLGISNGSVRGRYDRSKEKLRAILGRSSLYLSKVYDSEQSEKS